MNYNECTKSGEDMFFNWNYVKFTEDQPETVNDEINMRLNVIAAKIRSVDVSGRNAHFKLKRLEMQSYILLKKYFASPLGISENDGIIYQDEEGKWVPNRIAKKTKKQENS
jgi:hypothetical protein